MPEIHLAKLHGVLTPADGEAEEILRTWKQGQIVKVRYSLPRNYRFLKKWFALLKIGYDNWTPGAINSKYGVPEKNFSRFRADVTILAGHYETHVRLDGSVRVEPKSVSFAKMTEEEFSDLYDRTIDVLIKYVYDSKATHEEINETVRKYLEFA